MKKTVWTVLFLLLVIKISGQSTPLDDQYLLNPLSINPAYAGNSGVLNLSALYSNQWVGMKGAPSTLTFTADAPVSGKKVGLGLIVINNRVAVTKENQLMTDYAYRINLGKGLLTFGLGAGLVSTNSEWSDLVATDKDDQNYLVDSKLFVVPQISFGSYFSYKGFFTGFSLPRFFSYKYDVDKNKYQTKNDPKLYNYTVYSGLNIKINQNLNLLPSVLLVYTPENKMLYDINAHVNVSERFLFGASYLNDRSVSGLFQLQINKQLRAAYIYDYEISKLGKYNNGSHLIMLRYEFRYKVDAVNTLVF